MRLGRLTNSVSCEFLMQKKMGEWLIERNILYIDEYYVSKIGRRADFLATKPGKGLINIEAKCNDLACMIGQLSDHAYYCDYSFAFIPDYPMTPKWFKESLTQKGFGLIVFNYQKEVITEVFEAHVNKVQFKELKRDVLTHIRKVNGI
jgi:hypothetical protein